LAALLRIVESVLERRLRDTDRLRGNAEASPFERRERIAESAIRPAYQVLGTEA
jgi:hypothetical protein